ncbi:hypothetical protein [Effusibacillus consociatus]|uniref:Uncharacterized protein n=1 Tax=Effusibacillus consociatus TaxID=1117041 RepID=A0ABV9Q7V6_9BACL
MTPEIGYLVTAFEDFARIYCPEDSLDAQLNKFIERHPDTEQLKEFIRSKVERKREFAIRLP